jgi:RHS repeat-associated protein
MKSLQQLILFLLAHGVVFQAALAQDFGVDKTYQVSRTALKAGYTSTSSMKNQPASDVAVSISYFDRLGRPVQSVMQQASPAGNDVVQPGIYDQYGMATKQLLPYVAVGSTNGQFKTNAESAQASFYTTQSNIAHDNAPWTEVELEKSPLKRVLRQGGVGSAYQLSGLNTTRYTYRLNNSGDLVQRWTISTGDELVLDGNYDVNSLSVTIVAGPDWKTADGNNGKVFTFTDVFGREVLTRTYNGGLQYDTYTIYNKYENVRFVIPPQLVHENSQQTSPSNQTITTAELDKFAVQYKYDNYNRMVEQKAPGTNVGWVYYVYDNSGRLILSQDGEQRAANEWVFTKYDRHDRPVLTGIYGSSLTRLQMQAQVDANITPTSARYEKRGSTVHGYTNTVFPLVSNESSYLVVTYYDDYDFMNWGSAFNFNSSNGVNNGPKRNIVRGLETGSKVKVIGTTTWLRTVKYYDDNLHMIQAVTDNHLGYQDYLYTLYNYTGETNKLRIKQKYSSATPITTDYRYVYDDGGRLKEEWMSIDGSAEILTTSLIYNELGEVIDSRIHSTDLGATFAQSIDTRYNIRGALTNINNTARTNDGTLNDDTGDYFGMQFYYDSSPSGLTFSAKNDGAITGLTWSHGEMTSLKASSFGYTYDDIGQFGTAVYKEQSVAGLWTQNSGHFDVNTVTYDRNGNIETLQRKQKGSLIDDLSYDYDGNRVLAVNDLVDEDKGFKDGAELSTEYLYDANGNMTKDENKLISSITYNDINLPERITFTSGAYIQYTYDATGMRLAMEVYINSQLEHRADYLGGLILDDGIPEQLAISGGRAIIDIDGSARTYEYQYVITDHQGNTRLTFTTAPKSIDFPATFEGENAADEEALYGYIAETRVTSTAADANSDGGNEVVRLNATYPAGAAINIPVTVGDKLDMEVYAYYEGGSGYTSTTGLSAFITAVAGAFGGVNGGTPGEQAIYDVYNNAYGGGAAAMKGTDSSTVPAAYLNYILFDENMVSYQHGYVQITSNANWGHEKLQLTDVPVTKNGIISVYLTNESSVGHVYFDDMKVTLHESNIVQEDAYYPFGLPLDDNAFIATFVPNRFLYQGKEWETALALNLYDFHARQYDPALGRWLAMDPKGDLRPHHSIYMAMGNNPISNIDPDGEFFGTILTAIGDFWKTFIRSEINLVRDGWSGFKDTWSDYDPSKEGTPTNNAWRIDKGLYQTDPNLKPWQRILQFYSRVTWEAPQTIVGNGYSHLRNVTGNVDRVDNFGGATFVTQENSVRNGMSLGNYININIWDEINGSFEDEVLNDPLFMHEYGHTFDSRTFGLFYLPVVGLPSLFSAATSKQVDGEPIGVETHDFRWYEMHANRHAAKYFLLRYGISWRTQWRTERFETYYPKRRR